MVAVVAFHVRLPINVGAVTLPQNVPTPFLVTLNARVSGGSLGVAVLLDTTANESPASFELSCTTRCALDCHCMRLQAVDHGTSHEIGSHEYVQSSNPEGRLMLFADRLLVVVVPHTVAFPESQRLAHLFPVAPRSFCDEVALGSMLHDTVS